MICIFIIFIALPVLGWYIGVTIFDALTGHKKESNSFTTHVHNYYDNRQVNIYQDRIEKPKLD